jgi:uncharacterized protein YjcR
MGLVNMQRLKQVKSYARYAAVHRKALVRKALKLLDASDVRKMTDSEIAGRTGFPPSTIRDWGRRRERYPGWTLTKTMAGWHLRILSPPEEQSLAESICSQILIPGHIFQDGDFRTYTIDAWFETYRDNEHVKHFNCSSGDIRAFKKRDRFTSRAFHDKRRPSVTLEQEQHWTDRIEQLLRTALHDRILKPDENPYPSP